MAKPIKFRLDLQVTEQRDADGAKSIILKDPVTLRFFYLSSYEYELLETLDGTCSLEEALDKLKASGRYYSSDDAQKIVVKAAQAGLILRTKFGTSEYQRQIKDRAKKAKRAQYFSSVYFLFIPILNPDRFLEKTVWLVKPLLTKWTVRIGLPFLIGAMYLIATGWDKITREFLYFFNFHNLLYLWITIALAKLIHEFAHAYAAKNFGLRVPQMGVAFLIFFPCLYCNTTEAWQLADRRQRIFISAAGIVAEGAMATLAAYIWYFSKPGLINSLAFYLMTISFVSTVLFNGNPLLKFDGYFILIDTIRFPNLYTRAAAYLKYLFLNRVLGIGAIGHSVGTGREKIIATVYGISAFIYRIFLYTGIVMGVYYRFDKTLGIVLAIVAFVLFICRPLFKGVKYLYTQRGEIHMRPKGTLIFAAIVLLAVGLLSVPVSWNSGYPCYVASQRIQKLTVPVATSVKDVLVQKGSRVKEGAIMYTLDTSLLKLELTKKTLEHDILNGELKLGMLDEAKRAETPLRTMELRKLSKEIAKIREEFSTAEHGFVAPFDGVVTTLDDRMQEGFRPGKGVIVGELEFDRDSEVHGLIPEIDVGRFRKGQEVKMLFPMGSGLVLKGTVIDIREYSEQDLKKSPFSSRIGGEVATEEMSQEESDVPLEAHYKCTVKLPEDSPHVPLGITGRLVARFPPKSILSATVDSIVKTFNRESLF
ncbi:site-2 protease family protein [Thermodesulfobacteriota bacterium]